MCTTVTMNLTLTQILAHHHHHHLCVLSSTKNESIHNTVSNRTQRREAPTGAPN